MASLYLQVVRLLSTSRALRFECSIWIMRCHSTCQTLMTHVRKQSLPNIHNICQCCLLICDSYFFGLGQAPDCELRSLSDLKPFSNQPVSDCKHTTPSEIAAGAWNFRCHRVLWSSFNDDVVHTQCTVVCEISTQKLMTFHPVLRMYLDLFCSSWILIYFAPPPTISVVDLHKAM